MNTWFNPRHKCVFTHLPIRLLHTLQVNWLNVVLLQLKVVCGAMWLFKIQGQVTQKHVDLFRKPTLHVGMFKVSFQSDENKSSNLNMVHNSTTTRCRKPEEVTQSSLSQWLLHWKLDLERQTLCMLPCPHSTWDSGKRNFQKTWKSAGSMPWWENKQGRATPPSWFYTFYCL